MIHAQWDLSWLIWVIILASVAGLALLTAIGATIAGVRNPDGAGAGVLLIAAIILVVAGGIGTFVSLPWSGQYHRFVPKTGVVSKIGSRFLASDVNGGGTTQKYVVTFSNGQSYGCLDTRCANVAAGDHLTLLCERSFQFNAPNEGWDCNWGIDRKPNGTVIP